jgi:hypothetical protein
MFIDKENRPYFGDMQQGDREATPEEVAAWEASKAESARMAMSVSRFQARAALHLSGLLETVEAMMAAPETPALAKLAWADAQEFKRNSPTVLSLSASLGLTEAQLDALFTTAAGIDA